MAKNRKYEGDTQAQVLSPADVGILPDELAAPGEAPALFVPKPAAFLQWTDGTQFKFTPYPLPKKAVPTTKGPAVSQGEITVDGTLTPYFVTHNAGWATDETALEYLYMQLPNGKTGYVVIRKGDTFTGEFTVGEGKANRDNPTKVAKNPEAEAARQALQKTTKEANKKLKEAAAAEQAAADAEVATQ